MLTITFHNITPKGKPSETEATLADYDWTVRVNSQRIAYGTLKGHDRSQGWPALLAQLAAEQLAKAT